MIRFAIIVSLLEIALTAGAALLIAAVGLPDPFLSRTDLDDLGHEYEEYETWKASRFRTMFRYNTHARLRNPTRELFTSYRVNDTDLDFELRRKRELHGLEEGPEGKNLLVDENLPGQPGYVVRDFRDDSIRLELVRARGKEMLIVRMVGGSQPGAKARNLMSQFERHARKIQLRMLDRMRWR